jgi:uncharacterized protein YtpQ (UPF0354 family)
MASFLHRLRSLFGGNKLMTPGEFTREAAALIQGKRPDVKVEIQEDLEIRIADGFRCFLGNAYDLYRANPSAGKRIIGDVIAAGLEAMERSGLKIRKDQIVPVIKDRNWLEESRQAMVMRGQQDVPLPVHEGYNEELVICYAEDSEKGIRYLQDKDVEEARIAPGELRALAVSNLKRLLADVKAQGGEGLYMFTADGTYESSLILFDELWADGRLEVRGEIVIAVPSRELLLVTGTGNEEGMARLREVAEEVHREGAPYRLSKSLFVYRRGEFEVLR